MEEPKKFSKEAASQMVTLLLGGFAFVAALAWNDAVQSLFSTFFDPKNSGVLVKFIYAGLITLVITLISFRLSRYLRKDDSR